MLQRQLLKSAILTAALALASGQILIAEEHNKEAEDGKQWDVENPGASSKDVSIDTETGTWMTADLSSDGKRIVFDMLGDIYTMPANGGEATAITSGVAWDMQPRFSPDGKSIAFISDRDGADNVWIMNNDGSDPKQVSKEDFRLVHNPSWTPDGDYIAVRKHFTKTRSAGAGEIWLYHRSGGAGVQMVEKRNDQKDINDPAFSPDGDYLYYTEDVTPGDSFQYSKDSNGEIYQIKRLSLTDGRVTPYITGPGGAVRPLPSPDGKRIAFLRRNQYQTTLYLKDIRSGTERPVYAELDRDNQEIWALHGLYPNGAWFPDNQHILLWAKGELHKINVLDGTSKVIPMRVQDSRKVFDTVRFKTAVAPERFPVRMLRWVSVSPNGKQVLFQALGKLYVKDLPDGRPRRLTRQDEHFELFPAYSRDGKSVVYTSWDDQQLGAVRVVSARGGRSRVVTSEPGHYADPAFSPSGKQIVFRKLAGGFLRAPRWGEDPGVYLIAAKGGAPRLVTYDGFDPHFAESEDQLFVVRFGEENLRQLVRISLSGKELFTPLTSKYAGEFRVSPDGNWVAFNERFKAYIAAMPKTGKTVEIGPAAKGIPVSQVSKDAGEYLHWSGDGKTLYWALGNELFAQPLDAAFGFFAGSDATPEPLAAGRNIGFEADHDKPEGKLALVGGRVLTMVGDQIIEDGVVVIESNRIIAVGSRDATAIPADAMRIDVTGKTVLPGFIDVHWHGSQGYQSFIPEQSWINLASLAFGVTTIHDPSNNTDEIFAAKELQRAGMITAPRIFSTGTILYGATTSFTAEINSLEDARSHLRRMQAVGAESVKSYNQPRRNQRQQVLMAARELGINVLPEGGALFQANMNMVVDGHTGIEHSLPVADIYDDVIQLWSQTDVGYTPTLGVAYGGIFGERYWYQHTNVYEHERLLSFVPRGEIDPVARRRYMAPENEYNHIAIARHVNKLSDSGVRVNVGAHGQREGLAAHWEMWMLGQGGMSSMDILRAATINGAHYLGMDDEIGSLEPGKLADIAILDADPLENIRNSDSVSYVMVNGRLYDAASMNQMGNHSQNREPLYWEHEEPAIP